jgi:hypothetical protein
VQWSDNYKLISFIFGSKLHGQWDPRLRRSVRRGRLGLPCHSHWFQGVLNAEVDDAREGSWSRCREVLALLGY